MQRKRTSERNPRAREPLLWIYWHELGGALLAVWRSPRYSLPAVLTIALGIAGATAVWSVFSALLLRPLAFSRGEELVELGVPRAAGTAESPLLSAPLIAELQKLDTVFDSIAVNRYEAGYLAAAGGAKHALLQSTSLDFFDTLGVQAELGRVYTAGGPAPDAEDVVVVRHRYWLDELGGKPPGETLIVNEKPHLLLGVIPDDQAIPSWGEMWLPSRQRVSEGDRFAFWLQATGRLRSGVSVEVARARVRALLEALDARDSSGALIPIAVSPLRERVVGERRGLLSLMLAAVLAFQLLACANLAALLATRASVRQRERAVRSALGASRWTLVLARTQRDRSPAVRRLRGRSPDDRRCLSGHAGRWVAGGASAGAGGGADQPAAGHGGGVTICSPNGDAGRPQDRPCPETGLAGRYNNVIMCQ